MSVTSRVSRVLRRRRVQVAVAIVALGGAMTAVAVANIALLDVAGGAQDQVGGLSSRIDLVLAQPTTAAPATSPAVTTTVLPPATTATTPLPGPAVPTARGPVRSGPGRDRATVPGGGGDD